MESTGFTCRFEYKTFPLLVLREEGRKKREEARAEEMGGEGGGCVAGELRKSRR